MHGEKYLRGVPVCRGIAIGKPIFFAFVEENIPDFSISATEIEGEIARYHRAVEKSQEDIDRLKKQLEQEEIVEGAEILEAHKQMLIDPYLTLEVENQIRNGKNAESSFQGVIKSYYNKFNNLSVPYFRERSKDLQDIARRVMSYLCESVYYSLAHIQPGSIVFAFEFTPSDIAEANSSAVVALVASTGGTTSHAAIVAKAKGIPYVINVDFEGMELNREVIVDGRTGDVICNPSPQTLIRYEQLRHLLKQHMFKLDDTMKLDAETYDGYSIRLSANIDMINETEIMHKYGSHGVGLFRSEHLFLGGESFPTEEEQFEIYKSMVEKMEGLPIVIRTFDIGGDKQIASRKFIHESNPYLGCRAIRFLLKERELFKIQLRAILRASAYGDVSVMFPMVSTLSELREAKALVYETAEELLKNNHKIASNLRIGCMVEVPSAAIISDLLAKECDFLSIGTNDLVQYALAVDRDNHAMGSLYTPTQPSVLRLIKLVVSEANHQGIPVTVCGEVAGDPRFTPLLLGLGVHELSVASRYIPIIKNAIRNTSIIAASRLAEQVMSLSTAAEIDSLLNEEYKQNVPEDCFYNC